MTNQFKQEDIFSMFEIEDVKPEKVELDKAGEKMKAFQARVKETKTEAATSVKKPEKKDTFKLTANTVIRYANSEIPITQYFSFEEIESGIAKKKKGDEEVTYKPITEEDLRKKLEVDFPILVPKYTTMVYVEKQDVVIPIMQAKKNGYTDCSQETSLNEVSSFRKIPYNLLSDFIRIALNYSNLFGTEVYANIYYDFDTNDFFMDFPKQRVNRVLVTITEEPHETVMRFIDRRYMKVMEIHSHHVFSATPSQIDDENQQSPILYAIVGKINNLFPEVIVRTFNLDNQSFIDIDPAKVFRRPDYRLIGNYDTSLIEVD